MSDLYEFRIRSDQFVTSNELMKLPSLALVAFTVRCGRRLQPLYLLWRAATSESLLAIDSALKCAEETASGAVTMPDDQVSEAAYRAAAKAAVAARLGEADAAEALCAAWAGAAAHAAADAAIDVKLDSAAVPFHAWFAERRSDQAEPQAVTAARRDFARLCELDLGTPGELGSMIDPSEAGPLGNLWGDYPPEWWPPS